MDHHERCVLELVLPDGRPAVAKCVIDPDRADAGGQGVGGGCPRGRAGAEAPGSGARVAAGARPGAGGRRLAVAGPVGEGLGGTPARPSAGCTRSRSPGLAGFAGRTGWAAGLLEMATHWGPRSRAAGLDGNVVDAVRARVDRLVRSRPGRASVRDPARRLRADPRAPEPRRRGRRPARSRRRLPGRPRLGPRRPHHALPRAAAGGARRLPRRRRPARLGGTRRGRSTGRCASSPRSAGSPTTTSTRPRPYARRRRRPTRLFEGFPGHRPGKPSRTSGPT